MMKKRYSVLIRTAGGITSSKELGLGHIFRCINLAKKLKRHKIHFLVEDYGSVKEILNKNGFSNVSILKSGISINEDIKSIEKIIEREKIQMVIVDKYKIKKNYLKKLEKKILLVYISDLNLKKISCDILINGFIGFENKIIKNKNQVMLLGPKFQILNPKFSMPKHVAKNYDILATFGGIDDSKIIEYFLESLSHISKKLKVRCILGVATRNSQKIKNFQKNSHHKISVINYTNNMKNEIEKCEFGFCAGGITSYEFASLKIPFAIISQNRHQLLTAKVWEKKKIAVNIGLPNKQNQKKLINLLEHISTGKKPKLIKHNQIDGKGTLRIVKNIEKVLAQIN